MKYTKPEINIINDYPEDVYMSSGTPKYTKCKSIYLNGTYQKPTYNPIQDGYKVGRGCEGCPASDGSSCISLHSFTQQKSEPISPINSLFYV